MTLFDRWTATLDQLRSQGRYRQFAAPGGIDFTSNDYLGYASQPNPSSAEMSRSGAASRLLRGHHPVWDDVESALAAWHAQAQARTQTLRIPAFSTN